MSTYVLVHGAWHSGRAWDRVAPLLAEAGHRVLAPSLTGYGEHAHLLGPDVGLHTHIDDIVRVVDETGVILVGHSYAGMVIAGVADRIPERIAHLVFLDAMVPEDGESAVDVMPVTQLLIDQAARTATPWRIPPLPELPPPAGLFGVTDPADLAWLRSMLSDAPALALQERVRVDDAVPRTHIHCTVGAPERRPVAPPGQVWELPTGHDCMITMPRELTDLLLKLG